MSSRTESTRDRLLDAAKKLVMSKGFAGTSIDQVLKETGLTKGAFFHHFKGKADLARALVHRYALNDLKMFEEFDRQSREMSPDPLGQVMAFLKLFEVYISNSEDRGPGFAADERERVFESFVRGRAQAGGSLGLLPATNGRELLSRGFVSPHHAASVDNSVPFASHPRRSKARSNHPGPQPTSITRPLRPPINRSTFRARIAVRVGVIGEHRYRVVCAVLIDGCSIINRVWWCITRGDAQHRNIDGAGCTLSAIRVSHRVGEGISTRVPACRGVSV